VRTGVVADLLPALSASVVTVSALLRQGGRGTVGSSLRARNALIVAEIAVSVVLLAGTGLLIRIYLFIQSEQRALPAPLSR